MLSTLTFNTELLEVLAPMGYSLATDVAEWLVKQGVPFRDAHEITGELVKFCEQNSLQLEDPTDAQLLAISKHLTPQVREVIDIKRAIESRNGAGGTSLTEVDKQLEALRRVLAGEK
jgi:argininosuccinate lyase